MTESVTIGGCTLYCGDCRDVLPALDHVDAVVTDPPYGVMLGETKNGQCREKNQQKYSAFQDSQEYLLSVVIPAFRLSLDITQRALVTTGNKNAFLYPKPDDFGVWYNPAGTGRGPWGFILAHMILYYGKDPNRGQRATASSVWGLGDAVGSIKNKLHPCPKPLGFSKWMVGKASVQGETVLDPFMGSGTTGVACAKLGRKFIGIEIDRKYFDIACKRIEDAYKQGDLFVDAPAKPKQEALL